MGYMAYHLGQNKFIHDTPVRQGLRLSWPNVGDRRRAVVSKSSSKRSGHAAAPGTLGRGFVNLFSNDVAIYYRLTISGNDDTRHALHQSQHDKFSDAAVNSLPSLSVPVLWNPHNLKVCEMDLLHYFQHMACRALATFGQDAGDLGVILLRMALSNASPSSAAISKSLLAFSSLHIHGNQSYACEQKISALGTLSHAVECKALDADEATQHIATAMMLYSCEILQVSHSSGDWTRYLCGTKKIVKTSRLGYTCHDTPDVGHLLRWVHYNDVMARFSIRHWSGDNMSMPFSPTIIRPTALRESSSAIGLLELLLEIYVAVSASTASTKMSDDHAQFLKILDWKVRSLRMTTPTEEAFQLAVLIYLGRSSGTLFDEPLKTRRRMERAFLLLSQFPSCERQFPVFILGCEACTDEQRTIILDLISRTTCKPASRSFNHVKVLLEAIWAQHDLEEGQQQDTDYWRKLGLTISRCAVPPSFA